MKKSLSILLSVILVLSVLPINASASEVEEIAVERSSEVFAYFETNGDLRNENNSEEKYFYYNGVTGYGPDDKLYVWYTGSHDAVEYTGMFDENGFAFVCAENGDRIEQDEFRIVDEQQDTHWYLGDENYYYLEYAGKRAAIRVNIIKNPVCAVTFIPFSHAVITENTGGEWREDEDGPYYDYSPPSFAEGDVLDVTETESGNTVSYTYHEMDYENGITNGFYDSRGNPLPDSNELYTVHYGDNKWQVGSKNNYYIVEYKKIRTEPVYVDVVENPVKRIAFNKKEPVVYYEGNNMYHDDWDNADYYELPSFDLGDELIIYDKNDKPTVYTYTYGENESRWDGEFVCNGKEPIDRNEVNIDGHQNITPWILGENKCEVNYQGCSASFTVTIIENPVSKISFEKENNVVYYEGSHMHYDEWDDAYYYERPNFEEGDKLTVYDSKGTPTQYTFSTETWEFIGPEDKIINTQDIQIIDNQRETPWTLGNNELRVVYMGKSDTFDVSIIKNPVVSISYTPARSAEYFENSNGEIRMNEKGEEYYRYCEPYFNEGDVLTVNYSDERGTVTYTAECENYEFVFVPESGDKIYERDIQRSSDQEENPWTAGGQNYYTLSYMGKGVNVPVSIVVNPIESIDFTLKTPAVFTDGQQRYDEWDEAYYFDLPRIQPGDVLTVTYKDDRGAVAYTATYDAQTDRINFVAGDDVIEIDGNSDINIYSMQREVAWTPGGSYNYYIFEYKSFAVEVPVTIVENNVRDIKIKPPKTLTIYENQKVNEPDENGAVYEHYNIPDMPDGTILTITDNSDNDKDYVLTFDETDGERYFINGNEKIGFFEVFVSHNQAQQPWTVGGENYFTARYLKAECQVPVSIIQSDVDSIGFTKKNPVVLNEYQNGEWRFNDQGERFYDYRVGFADVGDVLTVRYKNGTSKEFTVKFDNDEEGAYLEAKDGERLSRDEVRFDDNQWNTPWEADSYNEYFVTFRGVTTSVSVKVQHTYVKKVVNPTCTDGGYTVYTCSACEDEYDDDYTKPLGHSTKDRVKKATLSADGKISKVCTRCTKTISTSAISRPKTFKLAKTSYVYSGKENKPAVTVTDAKGKKIAAANYTVKYTANKAIGTATATITFKGNYSGSKKLSFTVVPKGTSISKLTAKKGAMTVKWKKQATQTSGYEVEVATDKNFKNNRKTVTKAKNSATSCDVPKLKSKKNYYVRIRTYKKVNGKKFYSSWSAVKTVKTK